MILKTSERILLTVTPTDDEGDTVQLDGAVTWQANPSDKVTIEPVDDLSAYVYGFKNGATAIAAIGDADRDTDEQRQLMGIFEITVVNAEDEATQLTITAGEPEEV